MRGMVEEKPFAAFTISLIGLALYAIGALTSIYTTYFGFGGGFQGLGTMMGPRMMKGGAWSSGFLWSPLVRRTLRDDAAARAISNSTELINNLT